MVVVLSIDETVAEAMALMVTALIEEFVLVIVKDYESETKEWNDEDSVEEPYYHLGV